MVLINGLNSPYKPTVKTMETFTVTIDGKEYFDQTWPMVCMVLDSFHNSIWGGRNFGYPCNPNSVITIKRDE